MIELSPKANLQNQHVAEKMNVAHATIQRLIHRGFTVLSVKIEGASPIIQVQPCQACRRFDVALTRMKTTKSGHRQRSMVALFNHCQIRWTESQH